MLLFIQVSNLVSETNLAQRVTTHGVKAIDGCSDGRQPAEWDSQEVKKSLRDDAEIILQIDLDPLDTCRFDVPSVVQRSIMLIIFVGIFSGVKVMDGTCLAPNVQGDAEIRPPDRLGSS